MGITKQVQDAQAAGQKEGQEQAASRQEKEAAGTQRQEQTVGQDVPDNGVDQSCSDPGLEADTQAHAVRRWQEEPACGPADEQRNHDGRCYAGDPAPREREVGEDLSNRNRPGQSGEDDDLAERKR